MNCQIRDHLKHLLPDPLAPTDSADVRLLAWQRHFYWNEQLTESLHLGQVTNPALLHHSEVAILSKEGIRDVFTARVTDELLEDEAQYVRRDGYWWNAGLTQHYHDRSRFCLPSRIYGTENGHPKGDDPLASFVVCDGANADDVVAFPHNYLQQAASYFSYDLFS